MNDLNPMDLQDAGSNTGLSSAPVSRKILIVSLAAVIVSAAIAWCGLLGWGVVEMMRLAARAVYGLWTTVL